MGDDSQFMLTILLLLVAAMYFATMETAFASVSRIRMKMRYEQGNRNAGKALFVLDNFERAITTLLIGTNITHIASGAVVTLYVTERFGLSAVTIGTIITTFVVFFAGEMMPKIMGKRYRETFSLMGAPSLCFFMFIFKPISAILAWIGMGAAKLTGGDTQVSVTEDELYEIIEDMTDKGNLDSESGELLSSALAFSEVTAESVLTPRVDMAAIDVAWPTEKIVALIKDSTHSRLPVYEDTIDNIVGILQTKKYMKAHLRGRTPTDVRDLCDSPYFVRANLNVDTLLKTMRNNRLYMVIVSGSHGGTLGIVTIEDILEELVSEIWDEDDVVEESFISLGGGRFEVDATLTVDKVFGRLGRNLNQEEKSLEDVPLSTWVCNNFEHIPGEGDSFEYDDWKVTVTKTHRNKITTVRFLMPSPVGGEVGDPV